jgi:Fic family protein
MHVPPNYEAVRDAMPVFFEMLSEETDAAVRVVLGHFIFVYIHPYMDGNGRTGRFLMNVMLAAAGYPWTVVPVQRRDAYMAALEDASVRRAARRRGLARQGRRHGTGWLNIDDAFVGSDDSDDDHDAVPCRPAFDPAPPEAPVRPGSKV